MKYSEKEDELEEIEIFTKVAFGFYENKFM